MNKSELKSEILKEIKSCILLNKKIYIFTATTKKEARETAQNIANKIAEVVKLAQIQKIRISTTTEKEAGPLSDVIFCNYKIEMYFSKYEFLEMNFMGAYFEKNFYIIEA